MKKIILLFLGLITCSCEDFLNVEPAQEISIAEQLGTIEGIKLALNGAYFKMEDVQSSKYFIYNDLIAGNLVYTPNLAGSNIGIIDKSPAFMNIYDFNDNAVTSEMKEFYAKNYEVINNLNNILTYIDKLVQVTEVEKNQICAEALAMRGFLHFNLVQTYSQTYNFTSNSSHKGIVYADKNFIGGVDFPARKTCAETYSLIIKDIQEAVSLFTDNQALSGPNYSFFNKKSTLALLAKVALQKRDWNLAIATANEVINNSGYSLMTNQNYISEWAKPNDPISEIILEFSAPRSNDNSTISSSVAEFHKIRFEPNGTTITDYAEYAASQDLLSIFENIDIRKNNFINVLLRVNTSTGIVQTNYAFTKKFQDNSGTIAIRLSEIYLILAEANARIGNSSQALLALNIIRNRAGTASINNSNNLLEEIFLERRRELCFEGHLLFDCGRFNKSLTRNSGCISLLCNLSYPNPRFILPIPQSTIQVNQNLEQNESY